jgi:hypothetical protein
VRVRLLVFWVLVMGALVPGVVITMNRLLEPSGASWVRLESLTPYAMPLYVAALVALGLRAARLRGRLPRSPVLPGVLLATTGLTLQLVWFAPMVTGSNPPPAAGAETLRVMTANIYSGAGDAVSLVQDVSDEDVDLLVVEEITPGQLSAMEQAGIDAVLPRRLGEPEDGGAGTMVFAREPLGHARPLDTRWDGWQLSWHGLTVIAVHPVSLSLPQAWRRDHATILAAAEASEADLVVGDLNATVDHEPLRRLDDAGFRDATELANGGWQPTWPTYGSVDVAGLPVPRLVQIDHVLVGHRLAALGTRTLAIPGTDHRALVAEVAAK